MVSDRSRGRRHAPWRTVRARATAAAALAVAVALVLGVVAFAVALRWSIHERDRQVAEANAEQLVDRVAADGPAVITVLSGDDLVQVVDREGRVVAAGEDAANIDLGGATGRTTLGDDRVHVVRRAIPGTELELRLAHETDDEQETRTTALWLLLNVALLVVLVVAVATWRITGRALRPVARVRAEVDAISGTQLDRRLDVPPTGDEIAELAETMNRLLDRLESGSRAQRQFVSDASHELRSPLATIRQHAELATTHPGSVDLDELARVVIEEGERLRLLVDDLLVLATLDEMGPAGAAEVDLDDLALTEVGRFRAMGSSGVEVDGRGIAPVRVRGDARLLARVVRNLVANAVRHARTEVGVATGQEPGWAWLVVVDDGPGIPAADRRRVLERFVRLDDARARDEGGSGLGLAIVAAVVARSGGTILVDESPAGGARFTVRLPVA